MRMLIALFGMLCLITTSAHARLRDQWVVGFGQGVLEYSNYLDNEDQTFIIISDASNAFEGGTVDVSVQINGRSPKPQSEVNFFVDGDLVTMFADAGGSLSTACHACAANFDALWLSIRRGKKLDISFDDLTARFSLSGSSQALPQNPPVADFYR